MEKKKLSRRWLWYFSLIAALIVIYKLCDNLEQVVKTIGVILGILTPFIIGIMLAFLLHRPTLWVERQIKCLRGAFWGKSARPLSLGIVYLALFGLLALLISLVLPRLTESLTELIQNIPDYAIIVIEWVEETIKNSPLETENFATWMDKIYTGLLDTVARLLSAENLFSAVQRVLNATMSLFDIIIGIIISIYMLSGREYLTRATRSFCGLFLPEKRVSIITHYGHRTAAIFYNYFYGALLDSLVVGIVVSIGLAIFKVPYAVLLGMLLGLLNMIPYFGAIIGGIIIAFVSLLTNGLYAAIGVIIYVIVVQQLDANILQPRVVGDSVGLRPIYVLLAITLFGGIFGFWGIFLGVPLMAVIQMLVRDAIQYKHSKAKKKAEQTDTAQ